MSPVYLELYPLKKSNEAAGNALQIQVGYFLVGNKSMTGGFSIAMFDYDTLDLQVSLSRGRSATP